MNKNRKNIFYLLVLFIIVILINIVANIFYKRIDLTQDKRFTLSPYTKHLLDKLNGKIQVTVYLDGSDLPIQFKRFRMAIKEELE